MSNLCSSDSEEISSSPGCGDILREISNLTKKAKLPIKTKTPTRRSIREKPKTADPSPKAKASNKFNKNLARFQALQKNTAKINDQLLQ